ncbi:formimidoylglutamase [Pseudidiomarina terrestris]|uniref:Formimidoylglutamase n=1 Tax=Pseudidiomarina terrestris TaxID=2820060 RepID=A0AAW7QZE1_9GAMM|nr:MULTISPECIES: formimidoylglutamase [unclassified Pseudidiomarina]MDN7124812.1 formimidoylglutamase [Pseudidiomarina sp. 1APP75-32.1]MDN7125869.1 formimidoylglutamase [Pseudidiomarina sp. 1APR75-33.1]MDN7129714.1 formimidoylglutamase [Pseudidiomarina sp. 1APR75-15]MDN7136501.1 formimidoylglutamase [Pseudidiomarina sp. 1ASP75-5]MDN7138029.1 formimidoylglutamase [Pseudidiomarina sp. 1ASP75-14]
MYLSSCDPSAWCTPRQGEVRLGQTLHALPDVADAHAYREALASAYEQGARIAIIGVPESIGPRGNLGRGGAESAWPAALKGLCNLQATPFIACQELLMVGQVVCDDLQEQAAALRTNDPTQLNQLRDLCAQLDQRVMQALLPLFEADYEVILIGGGHNNAYPLLRSLSEATSTEVAAMNLDPHADFRSREGRHSGNGFSYACTDGFLGNYHVVGLHEGKNNAESLRQLANAGFTYTSVHQLYQANWTEELAALRAQAEAWCRPLGIEVDVDALQGVPASAINFNGLTVAQGYSFVAELAAVKQTRYLHLAEAAPSLHPAGREAGDTAIAQLLSELVLAYLHGHQRRTP